MGPHASYIISYEVMFPWQQLLQSIVVFHCRSMTDERGAQGDVGGKIKQVQTQISKLSASNSRKEVSLYQQMN